MNIMKAGAAVLGVLLATVGAQGFTIDFDAPGYATGSLHEQGATATQWWCDANGATIQVVTDPLDSGNQIAQTQYSGNPTSEWCYFVTSSDDLGFTLDKENGTADFSVKFRKDAGSGGTRNMVLYVGYNNATDGKFGTLQLYGNGGLQYTYGGGGEWLDEVPTTTWTEISGHVDYSTGMVTITQDGVNKGSFAFQNPKETTGAEWLISVQNANYGISVAMDDLAFTPEPATMSLLTAGALGMLIRRKR